MRKYPVMAANRMAIPVSSVRSSIGEWLNMATPPTNSEDAADYLDDVYNELLNKRVALLKQLDDNHKQMDDILLEISRLENAEDEPKKSEATE